MTDTAPEKNLYKQRLTLLAVIFFGLGAIPLLASAFGVRFLPSLAWAKATDRIASIVGLTSGVAGSVWFYRLLKKDRKGPIDSVFHCIFGFLFLFASGTLGISASWPMFYTLVAGKQTELEYVVSADEGIPSIRCRNAILFEDLHAPSFDGLCNFPKSFRDSLHPGQKITVSGYGTYFGVFVKSARASGP